MTADLRREEIARIAAIIRDLPDTTTAWLRTGTVWLDAAEDLYDAGLRFAPDMDIAYQAGLEDGRSQDTATARIAELEGALEWACDIAGLAIDHIDGLVQTGWSYTAQRRAKAIVHSSSEALLKARAVLSGETRTDGAE